MRVRMAALPSLAVALCSGQTYIVSTIAGGAPPPKPVAGTGASIGNPADVASDALGNVYFLALECALKLDSNGVTTRVAGNWRAGYFRKVSPSGIITTIVGSVVGYLPVVLQVGDGSTTAGAAWIAVAGN